MWERVIAFKDDPAAATGFVAKLTDQWRICENKVVVVEQDGNSYELPVRQHAPRHVEPGHGAAGRQDTQ